MREPVDLPLVSSGDPTFASRTDENLTSMNLDGRRIVVDLSDADLARLTEIAARRGVERPQLVLGWIRRGLLSDRVWDQPGDQADRVTRDDRVVRDVEVAQRSDELFRDLLGDHDHSD